MKFDLMNINRIRNFFKEKNYKCYKPYSIIDSDDTVFVSAGIQPLLKDYKNNKIDDYNKLYVAQPVIRTQYSNCVEEGSSIAFVNVTTACFNNSEDDHIRMIDDWYNLLYEIGMNKNDLYQAKDILDANWGSLELHGKRIFHYYKNLEIGDTTFFTKIIDSTTNIRIDSMSDLGFGLERLRWKINNGLYYDLYSNSEGLNPEIKAYLSVLSLLAVNDIKPSNKNSGYRARSFSKKLINILKGKELSETEEKYLEECIRYWSLWQEKINSNSKQMIINEYIRNGNRYILNLLSDCGYDNLSGININVSRAELIKRLESAGVESDNIKKIVR